MKFSWRQLRSSDLKEPDENIIRIVDVYNEIVEQLVTSARRGTDEVASAKIVEVSVNSNTLPVRVKNPLNTDPRGIFKLNLRQIDGTKIGAVTDIEWKFVGGEILIEAVYGTTADTDYRLTMLVM